MGKSSTQDAGTGEVLLAFALQMFGIVFSAWVFTELWRWFVVPTFGLAPLHVAVAAGLLLVARFATGPSKSTGYDKNDPLASVLAQLAVVVVFLVMGFIVALFMPR